MAIEILIFLLFLEPILSQNHMSWEDYKKISFIRYMTLTEINYRRRVYLENLAKIQEHNDKFRQGLVSYSLVMNQFGHLTQKEFLSKYAKSYDGDEKLWGRISRIYDAPSNVILPEAVDWRSERVVTPVKNQDGCGACYSFGTVSSIESRYAIKHKKLVEFSEQQILDCTRNSGCAGGTLANSFQYARDTGLTTRASYPYEGKKGFCRAKNHEIAIKLPKFERVSPYSIYSLQAAVALEGPVTISLNSSNCQFMSSKEILQGNWCGSRSPINHMMSVVGYNTTKEGVRYWIVKNSWGENWGDKGYLYVEYTQADECGVVQTAILPYV